MEEHSLMANEQKELTQLEWIIEVNLKSFYKVGMALMRIRDGRLYRENHKTFEEYCRDRWGFTKSRANQLISATSVYYNLTTTVVIPERQLRPLISLEPEQQQEVWKEAVDTAPEGKVTAEHVTKVVNQIKGKETQSIEKEDSDVLFALERYWKRATKKDKNFFLQWISKRTKEESKAKKYPVTKNNQVGESFKKAWESLLGEIKNEIYLKWIRTSKEAALHHVNILIDIINRPGRDQD